MAVRATVAGLLAALLAPILSAAPMPPKLPLKVMLIGDSLSVGPFGRALEASLRRRYGDRGVGVFASCGSSPEDWLPGTPVFVTNCGYRQFAAGEVFSREYDNGRRPPPVKTPKLTALFARYRPELIIVQLGTNWMDRLAATRSLDGQSYRRIIRDFIRELRRGAGPGAAIVWVLPPASAQYPAAVHEAVDGWLVAEAQAQGFRTINSRALTAPYVAGRTGADGVHYSDGAGRRWARGVMTALGPAPAPSLPLAPGALSR
ncbi:MAG: SGNH/GDSL hydrolase family protein [Chthoniobacterales bacterium]